MADEYGGLFGAYAYAFRRSSSHLFRSYAAVSAVAASFTAVVLGLGLVTWLANPTGVIGEHALLVLLGLLVVLPLLAPVLVVARRHRLGRGRARADFLLGLAGYGFLLSVFLALLVFDPNDHAVAGPMGAVVAAVDTLPAALGVVPPLLGVALIVAAERLTRPERRRSTD